MKTNATFVTRAALRAFKRDVSNARFIIIGVAVVIAVASLAAVDLFTDRVRNALGSQSSALLAADLALISNYPIRSEHTRLADGLGLQSTTVLSMRTVVEHDDQLQLVELKAVADAYPLRGELVTAARQFGEPVSGNGGPPSGAVWVEPRLLQQLGVQVEDTISIGAATLRIDRVLVLEPDRGGDLFNLAPRVLMSAGDLDGTRLISPGSRVRYKLLVAGPRSATTRFRSGLDLDVGERLLTPESARPEIRAALHHAEQYLGLATLTTVLIAGIAIALASRSFAAQQRDTVAVLRTFGASRAYVTTYFAIEIGLLALVAAVFGAAIGWFAQDVLTASIGGWTQAELPPANPVSAYRAMLSGIVALSGFTAPQILALRDVPPLRVLRRDAKGREFGVLPVLLLAATALIVVVPWGITDHRLTIYILLGVLATLGALLLSGWLLVVILNRVSRNIHPHWRFGIANIARRRGLSMLQICGLGLGLTGLLVLAIVRADLLADWRARLPADAPNQFLVNIQPQDVAELETFLQANGIPHPAIYPMVRARLTGINDKAVAPDDYDNPRARRLIDREFNLSWSDTLKEGNRVVTGRWFDLSSERAEFSVEIDLAKTLAIQLGDRLTYRAADREIEGTVTSLRSVQWDSMRVNFFVEAPPGLLSTYPATFITSFRLDDGNYALLPRLVDRFPSVTVLDVAALVEHVQYIMDKSIMAIEFVFFFTLAAGALVLIAGVEATQSERVYEAALLKTLGARRPVILRIIGAEFITIGLVTGLVASIASQFTAWLLATRVLELNFGFSFWVFPLGIGAAVGGVTVVGLAAISQALKRPAVQVLRAQD